MTFYDEIYQLYLSLANKLKTVFMLFNICHEEIVQIIYLKFTTIDMFVIAFRAIKSRMWTFLLYADQMYSMPLSASHLRSLNIKIPHQLLKASVILFQNTIGKVKWLHMAKYVRIMIIISMTISINIKREN